LSTRTFLKRNSLLPGISEADVDEFLGYLLATWFRSCFDDGRVCAILTNDERIPEVAAQSGAMIVTHNTKDFTGTERLGVVRTPAEFLKILREGQ